MTKTGLDIAALRSHIRECSWRETGHARSKAFERDIHTKEIYFKILMNIDITYVKSFFDTDSLTDGIMVNVTINDGRSILAAFSVDKYDDTKIVLKTVHEYDPLVSKARFEERPAKEWFFEAA